MKYLALTAGVVVGAAILAVILVSGAPKTATAKSDPFQVIDIPSNIDHLDLGVAPPDAPFFPSRASSAGRKVTPSMFDSPEICAGCHAEIYQQWNGSMHSNSWTDPIYRAALDHASKATGGKVDKLCMGCHTPIGVLSGEATPAGKGMSAIADRGISCEVCHNISDSTGIGNGAFVLTPKLQGRSLKFGPFTDARSPYHDTAYSELHTKSEFCAQCHNVTHPFNRMPIERTYDEWRDSPYAGLGIQCQDCHMKPVPGKAAPMGKERPKIYTHYFVGGNAIVPALLGSPMHADMARQMLAAAATVEIQPTPPLHPGAPATLGVRVHNVGAGHKLPTGFPEGREMWLDVKVTDATGRLIYRSGAVRDGRTEPGTKSFKVVLGDKTGKIVDLEVTDASVVLYDTRILPKGYSDVEYHFLLPADAKGPLQVTAELNYWSLAQYQADALLGRGKLQVPIIPMTSAQRRLEVAPKPGPSLSRVAAPTP